MTTMPPVRRRILGAALRHYRQQMGYSLSDAARILECDLSKISRIETGQRGIRNRELNDLLAEYCVGKQTQETLAAIANPHGALGWRQGSGHSLPDAYRDMLALEMAASHIMVYAPQQVPDLLQCDEYAHALAGTSPDPAVPHMRRWPAVAYLTRKDIIPGVLGPEITAVIGEAALRHMPGSPAVIRAQLAALVPADGRSGETRLQVLPDNKAHAARGAGSFTIFRYTHVPGLQVVYLRGISGGIYIEDQREAAAYESAFRQLSASALTTGASAVLIRQLQDKLATQN